jgi:hypothetical protein
VTVGRPVNVGGAPLFRDNHAFVLAIIWRHGASFGWNHWRPASALFNCPVPAQAGIALLKPVLGRA